MSGPGGGPQHSYFPQTNSTANTEAGRNLFPVTVQNLQWRKAAGLDWLGSAESEERDFGGHPEAHRRADGTKAAIHVDRRQS